VCSTLHEQTEQRVRRLAAWHEIDLAITARVDLQGEQIPLAARIFAVVDAWDALCSDRLFRKAWSEEKAREYIRDQAGKHFDPKVVEVFLEMDRSIDLRRGQP